MRTLGIQHKIGRFVRRLRSRDAVAATEYAILLALIMLGAMGTIQLIGDHFRDLYTTIADAVGETM